MPDGDYLPLQKAGGNRCSRPALSGRWARQETATERRGYRRERRGYNQGSGEVDSSLPVDVRILVLDTPPDKFTRKMQQAAQDVASQFNQQEITNGSNS